MNAVLKVKDLDSGTTNEVPLTNAGDSFTGSYTIPDEHDYELTVRAEEKSFYRETQPVTISAKAGATSGTNTGTTQPTTPAEKSKLMPLILLGLGLLVLLVAAYFIWKAMKIPTVALSVKSYWKSGMRTLAKKRIRSTRS